MIIQCLSIYTSLVCLCAFSSFTLARNAPNCSYDNRFLHVQQLKRESNHALEKQTKFSFVTIKHQWS